MKKLVIANSNFGEHGKSSSIKEVFNQLRSKYPTNVEILIDDDDIKAIVIVNGIKVGIESQGDPYSRMQDSMDDFVNYNCEIIVAACRTKWGTYEKIQSLNTDYGYDIIWATNDVFCDNKNNFIIKYLNKKYAKHVIKLIEDRITGNI